MKEKLSDKPVPVRFWEADDKAIKHLAQELEISEALLIRKIVRAGIAAIRSRVPPSVNPLRFDQVDVKPNIIAMAPYPGANEPLPEFGKAVEPSTPYKIKRKGKKSL